MGNIRQTKKRVILGQFIAKGSYIKKEKRLKKGIFT